MRRIVVRGEDFRWQFTDRDTGFRVVVVSPRGRLRVGFRDSALITPHAVRRAIEIAIDRGWTSGEHQLAYGDVDDRPVALPPPPAISDEEAALLDAGDLAVYADWLLERGDPQGELIAHGDAALQATVLGPIADVTVGHTWDRGLLVGAGLFRRKNGVVSAAIGHRAWRTVRTLDARESTVSTGDAARIVAHPVMRDLRCLSASPALVDALAGGSFPRLTHLAIEGDAELAIDAPLEVVYAPRLVDGSSKTRISRAPAVLGRDGGVFAPFWQSWDHPGPTASRQDGILTLAWAGPDHPRLRNGLLEGIFTYRLPRVFDRAVAPFSDPSYAAALDALH